MSVLPFVGIPLHWPPALLALTALVIAPGAHLLLSPLLEGRRVTWHDDYAAVLIGDPLLAVAVGFAANLSRPAGPHGFPASWAGGCAWIAGGWAFGFWQSRHELSTGRYSRAQTLSPTKLWHQYIVYPVLGYWVTATEWSAYGATGAAPTTSRIVQVALVIATTGTWAMLTADAVRRPKLGHGTLDRARLRTIARRLIHRRRGALEVRGPGGVAVAVDSGAEPVMGFEAAGQVGHERRFWTTAWPNRSDRRPTISGR
jgi:hypothetical protein